MGIALGAIADDFTGATDLASVWTRAGARVSVLVESAGSIPEADAAVFALKSRSGPAELAAADSLIALDRLRAAGADQILFKCSSTFDSTPQGNIGPVADALLRAADEDFALVCPAYPANGRTVCQGRLLVNGHPLHESPMKDHPLTPMRDSCLIRLLEAQSAHRAGPIPLDTVRLGVQAVSIRISELKRAGRRYGVADALDEEDLLILGRAASEHGLVIGASGIGMGLPANLRDRGVLDPANRSPAPPDVPGRAVALVGSCSVATREQVARTRELWPSARLDPDSVAAGGNPAMELANWAASQPAQMPVLVYSSADPEKVAAAQERHGRRRAGRMIEETLAALAAALRARGFTRFVVAGGETSGAVVPALGIRALRVGPEIAPGVPWCESVDAPSPLAVALKSGNFGGADFFAEALEMLG